MPGPIPIAMPTGNGIWRTPSRIPRSQGPDPIAMPTGNGIWRASHPRSGWSLGTLRFGGGSGWH